MSSKYLTNGKVCINISLHIHCADIINFMITPCIDITSNLCIGVLIDMYIKPLKGQ